MACQAVCQQLCLPTLAFKATDFCQLLEDAIPLPDLLLAAAAADAPDGHLRNCASLPTLRCCTMAKPEASVECTSSLQHSAWPPYAA
eukprot:353751-Chlamydomonas_euryale.AAC.8